MSVVSFEMAKVIVYMPDTECVPFVAKMQKAKTRKGKDYFVMRATMPKDIARKIDAKPGDYLFFRAKKAKWYHMLDWEKMESTWKMLPDDVRNRVIMDGLYRQGTLSERARALSKEAITLGATNPSGSMQQMAQQQIDREGGIHGSSI